MTPGDPADPVFVHALCRQDAPVVLTTSRDCPPAQGDEYSFEPPVLIPPSLVCAQTAARLASGTLALDETRVVLSWSRS
jgi:hypothetical protein